MNTPVIRMRGAETLDTTLDGASIQMLVYLFANGLDGDVRLEADCADGVAALRGLVLGVGSCTPVTQPQLEPGCLHQAGDECYRQHPGARVFLNPIPWDPDKLEPTPQLPPAPPPSSSAAPPKKLHGAQRLEQLRRLWTDALAAAGDLGAQLDRGYGGDGAPAAIVAEEAQAAEALTQLRAELKRQRRRSPHEVQRWAALHVVLHQTIAQEAAAKHDDVTVHVVQELLAAWSALRDGGLEVPVGNARVMTWYRDVVRDILAPLDRG